jgi:predicted anti-sigma-YlaC factor YlaD
MAASSVVLCCALGVDSMKRNNVPLGIVVAGVVLMIGCRIIVWWPGVILGAALILGVLVAVWPRRQAGRDPEVTIRPGGEGRPWRKRH